MNFEHTHHDSAGGDRKAFASRRRFLAASVSSLVGIPAIPGARRVTVAAESSGPPATARATILIVLCGGPSHIDTWDMKPAAPAEIRGEFQPVATSAPGIRLCEHLPLTAQQAHKLAIVNSVDGTDPTNSHLGYYYHLTGHKLDPSTIFVPAERRQQTDDWPFIGSVVASKRPRRGLLPNAISYPWTPDGPADLRAGQFAGRLGVEHDPLLLSGRVEEPLKLEAPALVLQGNLTLDNLLHRRSLLRDFDRARHQLDSSRQTQAWRKHQDRAFSLLSSAGTDAFNLLQEPEAVRERYGQTINAMGLLLARRLVEADVPFVTLYWMPDRARAKKLKCSSAGTWDTHGNNFNCLKKMLLPEFDQCYSALLQDLTDRGLLDSTLVLVTAEMGRRPQIGDPRSGGFAGAGRDHWTYCLTDLLAGGGIQGGQTYGTSDKHGGYPDEDRVTPSDIAKTLYHAMGIHDLSATDRQNRPYQLQEEGRVLHELLT